MVKQNSWYKPENRFSRLDPNDRRTLGRNRRAVEGKYMPFNEVMESFYTFVRVYGYQEYSIETQVNKFVQKYDRVASYKELIIERAMMKKEREEEREEQSDR